MTRPRDLADRLRSRLARKPGGGIVRQTSTLPVDEARAKAREILDANPAGGFMTIVENWRQLPDGRIEFTMRRLPTGDLEGEFL
jgi:hypothetical protein